MLSQPIRGSRSRPASCWRLPGLALSLVADRLFIGRRGRAGEQRAAQHGAPRGRDRRPARLARRRAERAGRHLRRARRRDGLGEEHDLPDGDRAASAGRRSDRQRLGCASTAATSRGSPTRGGRRSVGGGSALIPQNSFSALDPIQRVGRQAEETVRALDPEADAPGARRRAPRRCSSPRTRRGQARVSRTSSRAGCGSA